MAKLVNWHDFEKKMKEKHLVLFSLFDVQKVFPVSSIAATFLVYRYAQKRFIVRVKRGLYVFPDALPPEPYIANKLCEPSYVSLEFALSYHRVIPETVYEITSVTTKTTRRFEVLRTVYSFRRMQQRAFTGYHLEKQSGMGFYLADPNKAFVDTLYYRLLERKVLLDRFDKSKLNLPKALTYATLFQHPLLLTTVKTALS